MDKNEIGLNAGKVWQLLSNNDKWSYGNLKKKSGLKDKDLGAALGWLAREDKIEFEQEEEKPEKKAWVRGTRGTYKPQTKSEEEAYLKKKYGNNKYANQ